MKTCYISSDSDGSQNPLQDKICMLRVKRSRVYGDNVPHAIGIFVCTCFFYVDRYTNSTCIGIRVKDLFGTELNETCHMGPEPSIYGHAINALIQDWSPDFRQLYSNHLYSSVRHLTHLSLLEHFPGILVCLYIFIGVYWLY